MASLKAPVLDGRHEHPVLPRPDKPAEMLAPEKSAVITKEITVSGIDTVIGFPQRAVLGATPDDTVMTLKAKIKTVLGIPPDQQRLMGAAAKMEQDGCRLGDCGILLRAESIVYVTRKLRGGGGSYGSHLLPKCPLPPALPSMSVMPGQTKLFPG